MMLMAEEEERRLELAAPPSRASTRSCRRDTLSARAMSPKSSPRRNSRPSNSPRSHFHHVQQEQKPRPKPSDSSLRISAYVALSLVDALKVPVVSEAVSTAVLDIIFFSFFRESSE